MNERDPSRAGAGEPRASLEPVKGALPSPSAVETSPPLGPQAPTHEAQEADEAPTSRAPQPFAWKVNLALLVATLLSTFLAGALYRGSVPLEEGLRAALASLPRTLWSGWSFAVPLLAILLAHEFAHYIAARWHRVDASLPYFIPLPLLSPFGTMGAVIAMRGRIRSRDALLDIGASGPLAGLCVAIPILAVGLRWSTVGPLSPHGDLEGQCLLYLGLKRLVVGPIPEGYDVFLHPTAFAGWAGLLVTMLNLVAVAQLDGGHIAYALFGPRQNRYARALHAALLLVFAFNLARFLAPVVVQRAWNDVGQAIGNATFWFFWYLIIAVIMRVGGAEHPPTEPGPLSPLRKRIGALCLVVFVLLFMPTPWTVY